MRFPVRPFNKRSQPLFRTHTPNTTQVVRFSYVGDKHIQVEKLPPEVLEVHPCSLNFTSGGILLHSRYIHTNTHTHTHITNTHTHTHTHTQQQQQSNTHTHTHTYTTTTIKHTHTHTHTHVHKPCSFTSNLYIQDMKWKDQKLAPNIVKTMVRRAGYKKTSTVS